MDRLRSHKLILFTKPTDPHPAEAPGVMSLRKMEGPLGTVDLPAPEAVPEEALKILRRR